MISYTDMKNRKEMKKNDAKRSKEGHQSDGFVKP